MEETRDAAGPLAGSAAGPVPRCACPLPSRLQMPAVCAVDGLCPGLRLSGLRCWGGQQGLRTCTVTGGKWFGPLLMMKHPKVAVGRCLYLHSCAQGYQSDALKSEAEKLSLVGLLLAIVMVAEGVLETEKGSLSTRSRTTKELVI